MSTTNGSNKQMSAQAHSAPRRIEPIFDASGALRYVRNSDRRNDVSSKTRKQSEA